MAISVSLNEGSSGVVSVSLTDHTGSVLGIGDVSGACWQLMKSGSVVNNRSFANGALTALEWPLTAADLAEPGTYTIAFTATYSSIIGGDLVYDLVVNEEGRFLVRNLKSLPVPAA